jgi:predicted protein tyrosine phosphatase
VPRRLLFVCGRNRLRSPTAEQLFATHPGVECASAGLSPDAEIPLTPELIHWADLILVMEPSQQAKLRRRFGQHLHRKRVVCLRIPDRYGFMDAELVTLLRARVGPFLSRSQPAHPAALKQ